MVTDRSQGGSPVTSVSYSDLFGNPIKTIRDQGGLNIETTFEYDIFNRPLKVIQPIVRNYNSLQPWKTSSDQEDLREEGPGTTLFVSKIDANSSEKKAIVSLFYEIEEPVKSPSISYIIEYDLSKGDWVQLGGTYTIYGKGPSGYFENVHEDVILLDKKAVRVTVVEVTRKTEVIFHLLFLN